MEKNFKQILFEINNNNFQEKKSKIKFPDKISDLPHIIIYGPQNSGKYYYSLSIIHDLFSYYILFIYYIYI